MKRSLLIIGTVVLVFALIGIALVGAFQPMYSLGVGGASDEATSFVRAINTPLAYMIEEAPAPGMPAQNVETQKRMVIQTVDLAIVVADPKTRMDEIASMAETMGGFVVSSNLYTTNYGVNYAEAPEATTTIRVPQEKIDDALKAIKKDAVKVNYENRSSDDVTNAYVDLQSRLKAKQAAEKKLLEFLDQATDTEGVLAVYIQLQQIQSDIEVLKGQIQYYDESVALSAISIRLIAQETIQPVEVGGWKLQGAVNDAVQDLVYFTQEFTRSIIRFALFTLPSFLLLAIPFCLFFLIARGFYRKFRKPKAVEAAQEEKK
ncbi:MAG: DUF4349 domain-containing protein [Anaerolineaceae bacterium]|jgi:hypothetical protein|nr:DUF4349 domain-containing protein [Anaerolineaceae bacterium]OQY87697.1 MAG: hypothetical protein B6D38_11720 [Anaerolineae bacterium UTCFX1]